MLSVQIIVPSSGKTNLSSLPPEDARSPDQTKAAQTFFWAKSWRYSLPVNRKPLSTSGWMSAATALRSASVTVAGFGSIPSLSNVRPNVSRASVRKVNLSAGIDQMSASLVGALMPLAASVLAL